MRNENPDWIEKERENAFMSGPGGKGSVRGQGRIIQQDVGVREKGTVGPERPNGESVTKKNFGKAAFFSEGGDRGR